MPKTITLEWVEYELVPVNKKTKPSHLIAYVWRRRDFDEVYRNCENVVYVGREEQVYGYEFTNIIEWFYHLGYDEIDKYKEIVELLRLRLKPTEVTNQSLS